MTSASRPVLEVRNLGVTFSTPEGDAPAVQGVNLRIERGETLGVVGESGCGKTVTALAIMRLVRPPGRIVSGEVLVDGDDLLLMNESEMRALRGNRVAMIFQEPMTSLNPVFTIGFQITEALLQHTDLRRNAAKERAVVLLRRVGIPHPEHVAESYPHQLSGGMRQRALIAMNLACVPSLLIADEPTTAIDVTMQVQILRLINRLKNEFGMGVMLITHDLGVVAESCNRVAVMYASHVVETGHVEEIFSRPMHPYTVGLLQSIPGVHEPKRRLTIIPGQVPRPQHFPKGCNFSSRCSYASEKCMLHEPVLGPENADHMAACWHSDRVLADQTATRH